MATRITFSRERLNSMKKKKGLLPSIVASTSIDGIVRKKLTRDFYLLPFLPTLLPPGLQPWWDDDRLIDKKKNNFFFRIIKKKINSKEISFKFTKCFYDKIL